VAGEVRYYTVEDAAQIMRLSPERVREMLEDGELEGVRAGDPGGWRVPLRGGPIAAAPPPATPPAPPPMEEPVMEPAAGDREAAEEPPSGPSTARAETRELPEEPGEPRLPAAAHDEQRQLSDLPRGDAAATIPEPTSESGWVTTQQAARALGISARTVRWHIERGNLDAKPEGEGVERTWRVSVDSLQAFRDSRQRKGQSPGAYRAPTQSAEIAAEDAGSAIRELADRLVEEARRAEAARVRLELAERAQSSLEAELSEERRRREEAERQRREAEMERDTARRELETLQQRREKPSQMPPGPGPATTPPAERGATQRTVEPVSETGVDTAAAAAGPLKPPEPPQEPPQEVQRRPVPGRRGLLRRIFRG
jgi:excisionase family DNA binding protein